LETQPTQKLQLNVPPEVEGPPPDPPFTQQKPKVAFLTPVELIQFRFSVKFALP
jgi:hypothetical protein